MKKFLIFFLFLFVFLVVWNRYVPSHNHPDNEIMNEMCDKVNATTIIAVDFSRPSCEDRLYIFRSPGAIIYTGPVLHGCGGKSTPRTPEFSNQIGSNCSSLGVYELTGTSTMSNGYPCITLRGLSKTNSNAAARHIYIHPSIRVSLLPFEIYGACFPLTNSSKGCFAVSYQAFRKIKELFEKDPKIKIYAYCGT